MKDKFINSNCLKSPLIILLQLFLFLGPLLFACRKESAEATDVLTKNEQDFKSVFIDFWSGVNRNYVMWDMDTTNWDRTHHTFLPLFTKLDIKKSSDHRLAAHYLKQMTKGLYDGHFSIQFEEQLLRDSLINPADEHLKQRPEYHKSYPADYFDLIAKKYLVHPYYEADYNTDAQHQLRYKAGLINKNTLYFRVNSFSIYRAYHSNHKGIKILLDYVFENLANPDMNGIILDLRDNLGGDLHDLNFFVGRFIDQPLHYGSSRYKSNNNRFDYTPWMPAIIRPMAGVKAFKGKIVVLVNMYSVSMAELTAMALKSLPNTIIVGERTGGANGLLSQEADLNGGSFQISDFAKVTMASAVFKFKDDRIYEGIGFPPDIYVPHSIVLNNRDMQLEKGIRLLSQ